MAAQVSNCCAPECFPSTASELTQIEPHPPRLKNTLINGNMTVGPMKRMQTMTKRTATRRRLRLLRPHAATTSFSPAIACWLAAGRHERGTTSPRSACRRCWSKRAAHRPRRSRRSRCASSASALRVWHRIASATLARTRSGLSGRRSVPHSKPPSRRQNTPRCSAPRSMVEIAKNKMVGEIVDEDPDRRSQSSARREYKMKGDFLRAPTGEYPN